MLRFVSRRLAAAVVLLFVVLSATFLIVHVAPGDPTTLLFSDPRVSEETRQRIASHYGLDQPLWRQYLMWLGGAASGDMGTSITHGRSAAKVLLEKVPATFLLAGAGLAVELFLGLWMGVAAALRPGSWVDQQVRNAALFLYSVPAFWLALVLIDLLAVRAGLFPINMMTSDHAGELSSWGRAADVAHHLAVPALALGLAECGNVARFVRSGLVEVLEQDYVRTARASGLHPLRVAWVHALRNAVGPLLQNLGASLPGRLNGAVVIEFIFAWPGMGRATLTAIFERDYPVVLAATVFTGVLVVLSTLLVDLLHAWVDPRVRDAL